MNTFKKRWIEDEMTILTVEHLTMAYETAIVADDISFAVERGDYVCIVGENGSGKTTLVKGLLGLLSPKSGKIEYHGIKPSEIGYLPQQNAVQRDFPASVKEVVLSGCIDSRHPFYTKSDKLRAREALEKMNAEKLLDLSYRDLSGGQQQRVLLARALCAAKKLMLLDEPANGLDPVAAAELYALIRSLNRDGGMTILMVSHDMHSAVHEANVILHMDTKVLFYGAREEYLKSEAARRFLGQCAPPNN